MNIKSIALSIVVAVALSACGNISYPTATRPSGVTPTSTKYVPSDTSGTSVPIVFPKIDRHPSAGDFGRGKLSALPSYNPDSGDYWQVDLRGYDLSGLDLRNSLKDLSYADFDDKTTWPPADKMPAGFDWKQIMNLGKNPGLNLQTLHGEGITGKNIGIAIIDQTLLVDHQEFADRIQLYEETADIQGASYSMHGPAVASIAVGKTVGVAPEADLYFIATAMCSQGTYESNDFACLAKSVLRIIEINRQLPSDRKYAFFPSPSVGDLRARGTPRSRQRFRRPKMRGYLLFVRANRIFTVYNFKPWAAHRWPIQINSSLTNREYGGRINFSRGTAYKTPCSSRWIRGRRPAPPGSTIMFSTAKAVGAGRSRTSPEYTHWRPKLNQISRRMSSGPRHCRPAVRLKYPTRASNIPLE